MPGNVFGASALNAGETLEVCLSKNSKLAVLMLIDESKSLRELKVGTSTKLGNDPTDSRVPALESVVRVLASAVESSQLIASANNKPLEVAIAIAGFGAGYNERMGFTNLDSKNVETVVSALEDQKERDSDLNTRYHTALDGSLASFESYSNSPPPHNNFSIWSRSLATKPGALSSSCSPSLNHTSNRHTPGEFE